MIKQHMQLVNIILFLASTGISFRNISLIVYGTYGTSFEFTCEWVLCTIREGDLNFNRKSFFFINRNSGPSPVSECGLAWRHWLSMHLMKSTFARERTYPAAPALDCIWSLCAWGNSHVIFLSIVLVLSFVKRCNNALSWRHISSNNTAESSLWH